jgi:hypothetical protein
MAVPSIFVAVIANGVLENGLDWNMDSEKERRGATNEGDVKMDALPRRRFRPLDLTTCLAASLDEAEPLSKGDEVKVARSHSGRGKLIALELEWDM